jgi:tRNA(Ile2) C34 agmatinyltransferase TiaS
MKNKKRKPPPDGTPPKCTDCGVEMERYENALDTGRDGWRCPECGWSEDDDILRR